MHRTSEYVSLGHPDSVADYVVSRILDEYLKHDKNTRFAMECQIKDNFVTLGGEVSSAFECSEYELAELVKDAVREVGYTHEYAEKWGAENALDADSLVVTSHVGRQSPDIAKGVDADGWGDQGIMWGMAVADPLTHMMPKDHFIAKRIGQQLYEEARFGKIDIGLDIKTQVSMDGNRLTGIVVAAPMTNDGVADDVKAMAVHVAKSYALDVDSASVVVNGTGSYVRHASQGDCGTTGRKLAVDFYGGNCRVGGGCPWGKDPTKADVTLNIYAHEKAKDMLQSLGGDAVYCAISCCIGRRDIDIAFFDEHMNEDTSFRESVPAHELIEMLGLSNPVFADKKKYGLFSTTDGLSPQDTLLMRRTTPYFEGD